MLACPESHGAADAQQNARTGKCRRPCAVRIDHAESFADAQGAAGRIGPAGDFVRVKFFDSAAEHAGNLPQGSGLLDVSLEADGLFPRTSVDDEAAGRKE